MAQAPVDGDRRRARGDDGRAPIRRRRCATIDVPTLIVVGEEDVHHAAARKRARCTQSIRGKSPRGAAAGGASVERRAAGGVQYGRERVSGEPAVQLTGCLDTLALGVDVYPVERISPTHRRAAEQTQRARASARCLFRNRSWLPVPFLLVALLVPAHADDRELDRRRAC